MNVNYAHVSDNFNNVTAVSKAAIMMALSQGMGMFPMVYRRKNSFLRSMGMIPEVFVHNLHSFCALKFVTKFYLMY